MPLECANEFLRQLALWNLIYGLNKCTIRAHFYLFSGNHCWLIFRLLFYWSSPRAKPIEESFWGSLAEHSHNCSWFELVFDTVRSRKAAKLVTAKSNRVIVARNKGKFEVLPLSFVITQRILYSSTNGCRIMPYNSNLTMYTHGSLQNCQGVCDILQYNIGFLQDFGKKKWDTLKRLYNPQRM